MVHLFYDRVREDALLGPIFKEKLGDDWEVHLQKMTRFWSTVLIQAKTYQGNPFVAHQPLDISEVHFNRWLELFEQTLKTHFVGDKASEATWRAHKMSEMFQAKMKMYANSHRKPLI